AAAPLLTISLAPVGLTAGIDPWVIGLIALMACNGFFLPYQSTTYLALYHGTNGRLFTHEQARPMAVAYGVVTFLALCASVPLWPVPGLIPQICGPHARPCSHNRARTSCDRPSVLRPLEGTR